LFSTRCEVKLRDYIYVYPAIKLLRINKSQETYMGVYLFVKTLKITRETIRTKHFHYSNIGIISLVPRTYNTDVLKGLGSNCKQKLLCLNNQELVHSI